MTFGAADLIVRRESVATWRLMQPLIYRGQQDTWTVPAGYVTDFASVPAAFVWIVNKTGPYTLAAILHDYLLTEELPRRTITSRDVDGVFRRVMREESVAFAPRWTMWAAVRLGALASRRRAYGRGFVRDLPRIALVGLGACWLLPAAALVLVSRGILRLLRF